MYCLEIAQIIMCYISSFICNIKLMYKMKYVIYNFFFCFIAKSGCLFYEKIYINWQIETNLNRSARGIKISFLE